jgi:EmrB/QacA subfamily drug resistance transporter
MDIRKKKIVIAIMVAMFLGAVEGTVVTTAIPTIVKELSGFQLISWVFSAYLLTSAISTPIYGKLSDLYGRKNTLFVGIIIFLIGSSLCGLSQNMYQLIVFRAIQGLGAGAIFTITFTIVGDVFSLSERAKVQGWVSSVWGISSLIGPFLGGFFIDYLSWHWIFFINIPFGIGSIILLQTSLKENFEKKKHNMDFPGIIVLSSAILLLLYGVMLWEKNNSFTIETIMCFISTAVLFIVFYFIETKAKEPVVPFEIFTKTNTVVNAISFLGSAILIGISVYLTIYMQNVLGYGATVSGLAMGPMSISWLLSSIILGKVLPKYGERIVITTSALILILSTFLVSTLTINSPLALVILYIFIMGFGFGGSLTTLTIVIQSSVDYSKRGAATASNSLLRTLGQTIGVSIFGSIFNINIVRYFDKLGIKGIESNNLYSSSNFASGLSMEVINASLNSALHIVFISTILIALVCFILSFMLPSGLKESSNV